MLPTSEARAASVDTGALYEAVRQELIEIVRAATPAGLERRVAATPEWRVRDVVAHVTGITVDLNRLDFGGTSPEEWTARQVDRHRDDDIEVVIADWDDEAPTFEEGLGLLGYEQGSHFVGDLHAHLQDVRSTLDMAPHDDRETVLVALDFYLGALDDDLRADDAGSLTVIAGDETHLVGTGEPSATITGPPFEILRALSGRRSLVQVGRLDWSGAGDVLAPRLSRYPFPVDDLPA